MVQTRCEVARPLSEWPVTVIQWGRAAAGELEHVSRGVTGAREVRLCAGVTGRNNILIIAWVKSLTDVQRFEVRLAQRVPGLEITDRAVALWPLKLSGHLLDEQGYRIGGIPLDVRTAGTSTRPPSPERAAERRGAQPHPPSPHQGRCEVLRVGGISSARVPTHRPRTSRTSGRPVHS
ncbi:Lrp/AsnC ligand binding domain-containing protein [Streptomyces sp. LN549]|uniref:Lrp/AsnC ligand binding domain-containing protein n=1 Tax=Streptomyces sp. LN549 TaxID=3112979 RepID=UPI00371A63BA